jgi:hypothetical protein
LGAVDAPGHSTIKLVLSPILGEERGREHYHSECAARDTFVDFAAKSLSYPELELVVPNAQAALL